MLNSYILLKNLFNMVEYGKIWLQYIWLNMVKYGYKWLQWIWLNMVKYGQIWLNMVNYG